MYHVRPMSCQLQNSRLTEDHLRNIRRLYQILVVHSVMIRRVVNFQPGSMLLLQNTNSIRDFPMNIPVMLSSYWTSGLAAEISQEVYESNGYQVMTVEWSFHTIIIIYTKITAFPTDTGSLLIQWNLAKPNPE